MPDFGERLGYDGKAVDSHGQTSRKTAKTPDADWGKRETTGVDGKTGNLWRKAKSWFGYGLRADTKYEIPVAFSVPRASRAETEELNGDKP